MRIPRVGAPLAALCLVLAGTLAPAADAAETVEAGFLRCDVASGWGFIFGSSKDLNCVFSPAGGGEAERYTGKIEKFGVDIGYTEAGVILWTVFAPKVKLEPGALAGTYVGATAEATAGLGLGANALVGGGNSIALQPVSVTGQKGLNVAAGIGSIILRPAQ